MTQKIPSHMNLNFFVFKCSTFISQVLITHCSLFPNIPFSWDIIHSVHVLPAIQNELLFLPLFIIFPSPFKMFLLLRIHSENEANRKLIALLSELSLLLPCTQIFNEVHYEYACFPHWDSTENSVMMRPLTLRSQKPMD